MAITIEEVVTSKNADLYTTATDKYCFCLDLLDLSVNDDQADEMVEQLEVELDQLFLDDLIGGNYE